MLFYPPSILNAQLISLKGVRGNADKQEGEHKVAKQCNGGGDIMAHASSKES